MNNKAEPLIRDGQHSVIAHLICRDAAAAIDFYVRAFGAVEVMRLHLPDGRLMHASIKIGDTNVMLADEMPEWGSLSPQSLNGSAVTLHLTVPDIDAVFARAIAEGAREKMPIGDMFWGDRYGKLEDPFGHQWSLATILKQMTPEEMIAAGQHVMGQAPSGCHGDEAAKA